MDAGNPVALVTGANRGIGLEICRQLARRKINVVLAARDETRGAAAVDQLRAEGLVATFHALDVASEDSISHAAAWMKTSFGRCDILVNNAGVMLDARGAGLAETGARVIRETFETNTLGPLLLINALLPLMRHQKYGRIVNLSSGLGQLSSMASGTVAYRISKTALNAVTRIAAEEVRDDDILVNAMCPGWVRTEMGGAQAPREVAQGADTAVWLATLPAGGPSGGFFRDRQPIAW